MLGYSSLPRLGHRSLSSEQAPGTSPGDAHVAMRLSDRSQPVPGQRHDAHPGLPDSRARGLQHLSGPPGGPSHLSGIFIHSTSSLLQKQVFTRVRGSRLCLLLVQLPKSLRLALGGPSQCDYFYSLFRGEVLEMTLLVSHQDLTRVVPSFPTNFSLKSTAVKVSTSCRKSGHRALHKAASCTTRV